MIVTIAIEMIIAMIMTMIMIMKDIRISPFENEG
jgi:hypothetical protein